MTVAELIESLKEFPQDTLVYDLNGDAIKIETPENGNCIFIVSAHV